jgi:hypothetical protein
MHFTLALDIKATDTNRRKEISSHIWDVLLSNFKRAKRLSGTLIIIKINSDQDWKNILNGLTEYINNQPEKIHFIMTPPMTGGRYQGLLAKGDWDFINEITDKE